MAIAFGIVLICWGLAEQKTGKAWFISRYGIARYTLEDDDWVFLMIVWSKIVGGALRIAAHFVD